MLKAIEHWASQSEENAHRLVALICVGLGLLVVASTVIAAIVWLPPGYWSS